MSAITLSLPPDLDAFVRAQVDAGFERSPENVIENALILLREERDDEENIAWLRDAVREGLESGPTEPFNMDEVRALVRTALERRNAALNR